MSQTVIELSRYQPESARAAAIARNRHTPLHVRARRLLQQLLTAVELLVTAAIGVCVLFCVGLTVSML